MLQAVSAGTRHRADELSRDVQHERFAVLRVGFRPFYLLAAIFAAFSVPLWAVQYAGWLNASPRGPLWHAHEMLFGFTMAVVAGFLFTAVRNWTGKPTPTGATLGWICALWIAGRALELTPFAFAAALVNAAFPVAVAAGIAVPLIRAGNRRNYFFIALLVVIAATELVVSMAQLGALVLPAWLGIQIALDVVLFIITVMAGRVIPMFTNNGVAGAQAERFALLERLVLGITLLVLVADIAQVAAMAMASLLALACIAHGVRLAYWKPWRTGRVALVWSLHVAYAWIVFHLAMRALAELGAIATPIATHALTIGAIGGITIAMMTRTARGHTGSALRADRFDVASYGLVLAAALIRVAGPLVVPTHYVATVLLAALMWSSAFAIYAARYWPLLTRARADGKPG
jgi:uncharacterized protein involved in response to NO